MNTKYLFILVIFQSSLLFGQSYIPTIEEGKKWGIIAEENPTGSNFYFPQITCDTILRNSLVYHYVRCDFGSCYFDNYIREDTLLQQVFSIDPNSNDPEQLFLDYTLMVGDTFPYIPSYHPVVDSVYEDFVFGKIRKVIVLDTLLSFIEGVGSTLRGPLPGEPGFSYVNSVGEVACNEIFTETANHFDSPFNFQVVPNPNYGDFKIDIGSSDLLNDETIIRIWTMLGTLVFEEQLSSNLKSINLSITNETSLLLNISNNQFSKTEKIILLK